MSFQVNRATILGNLTKDPELKYTPNGKAVATLTVATNRSIKNGEEWQDIPTFHRVVIWDKLAEHVSTNASKGDKIYIDGRIDNRNYEDKEGVKRFVSEIVAENVVYMTKRDKNEEVNINDVPDEIH